MRGYVSYGCNYLGYVVSGVKGDSLIGHYHVICDCCPFPSEAFMRGFDWLSCCFCGSMAYLLRLFNGVEVLLIGTK